MQRPLTGRQVVMQAQQAGEGTRMAHSPEWLGRLMEQYKQLPEFVREDLLEGLLVGGGIALPVAMLPNQDAEERAAALLGGITAATLGGAASRRIGAAIGARIHSGALPEGSFGYNLGRVMGREDMLDVMPDIMGTAPKPTIKGRDYGRAIGRAVGDEAFGVAGTIGALAAAQAMDSTPDEQPQPTMGEVVLGTVPGAVIGTAASGLMGGMIDTVGLNRMMMNPDLSSEEMLDGLRRHTVFTRGRT